jgi:hypothetical protein
LLHFPREGRHLPRFSTGEIALRNLTRTAVTCRSLSYLSRYSSVKLLR